jgi:hypothetical protein
MNFEPHERKFHYYHDQEGATYGHSKPRPFANTLCKMNSNVPGRYITTDPLKVTCKICRKDRRFQTVLAAVRLGLNSQYGKFAKSEPLRLPTPAKRTRHRRSWFGKLILQVEDSVPYNYDPATDVQPGGYTGRWRDATLEDLDCGVV